MNKAELSARVAARTPGPKPPHRRKYRHRRLERAIIQGRQDPARHRQVAPEADVCFLAPIRCGTEWKLELKAPMPGNRRIVTYIAMCISHHIDHRIVCKHAQRPQGDTMAQDRFTHASLKPQRLTRQRYPGLRTDLNRDRYLSSLSFTPFHEPDHRVRTHKTDKIACDSRNQCLLDKRRATNADLWLNPPIRCQERSVFRTTVQQNLSLDIQ